MILVTGASGRVGSAVVNALTARGGPVRAMVTDSGRATAIQKAGVEVVVADLGKRETLSAALDGVDKALLVSNESPDMPELHGNFVEAAKAAGTRHVVRMSILVAMMPDSPLSLARWHGQADRLVGNSGVPFTVLQPAYFMQNTLMSARTIASEGVIRGGMGDGKVGHIDIRDIAEVAAAVLTSDGHEGHTYVLTGPESLSMAEIASKLAVALARPVRYADAPADQLRAAMVAMGMPGEIADAWVQLAGMVAMGGADMVTPNVKEITGVAPRSFDQFARENAAAFNQM